MGRTVWGSHSSGATLSTHIQIGPRVHKASDANGTVSLPVVMRQSYVDHSYPPSEEVERE